MKSQWAVIVALLFSLLVAIFAIVNNEPVTINFLFATMETSAVLVILGSAAAGALIMGFLSLIRNIKVNAKTRELKEKVAELEKQIKEKPEPLEEAKGETVEGEELTEEAYGTEEKVEVSESK